MFMQATEQYHIVRSVVAMAIGAETMTRRSESATDFGVQTPIHSKYIPDPEELRAILRDQFGTGKFEVEVGFLLSVLLTSITYI